MSQQNVEIVRRAYEAMATVLAGPEQVQAWLAQFYDADIDYYPARKFPEAQPCHGREQYSQFVAEWVQAWSISYWAIPARSEAEGLPQHSLTIEGANRVQTASTPLDARAPTTELAKIAA